MNELNCRLLGVGETFVYAFAGAEDAEALHALLSDCTLIAMDAADWNGQLSPWPAPAIFRGQSDFAGGGEACLSEICDRVIPEIESDCAVKRRIIAGYSMAGLFSLYAASRCECFTSAVSASGSVWYEGFIDFLRDSKHAPECAYLSVGDREKLGRNRAFRQIEENTRLAEQILRAKGAKTIFELNPGGHFERPVERLAKGIRWALQQY